MLWMVAPIVQKLVHIHTSFRRLDKEYFKIYRSCKPARTNQHRSKQSTSSESARKVYAVRGYNCTEGRYTASTHCIEAEDTVCGHNMVMVVPHPMKYRVEYVTLDGAVMLHTMTHCLIGRDPSYQNISRQCAV